MSQAELLESLSEQYRNISTLPGLSQNDGRSWNGTSAPPRALYCAAGFLSTQMRARVSAARVSENSEPTSTRP